MFKIEGYTDKGVRYSNNQDSYWVARFTDNGVNSAILVLCDGMGGLEDGSYASQLVVSNIRETLKEGLTSKEDIRSAILRANTTILEKYKPTGKQCGTTCSVIVLKEGSYWGYHIGDSRIYHFRGGNYKVLTEDHTVLNVRRKKGITITPEMQQKYRSTLSRCIGVQAKPRIDYLEGSYSEGDAFVSCSDGFWHFWNLGTEDFNGSIQEVKRLGEQDNITAAVVRIGGGS